MYHLIQAEGGARTKERVLCGTSCQSASHSVLNSHPNFIGRGVLGVCRTALGLHSQTLNADGRSTNDVFSLCCFIYARFAW